MDDIFIEMSKQPLVTSQQENWPTVSSRPGEMDFDGALSLVGNYGRFQKLMIFVLGATFMLFGSMSYWAQIFILLVPEHHCHLAINSNNSGNQIAGQCGFYPIEENPEVLPNPYYESFMVPARGFPYLSQSELTEPSLNLTPSNPLSSCTDGWQYDFSVISPSAATENDWVCQKSWKVSFSHSVYWFGSMIGYALAGFALDRFGRWKTILGFSLSLGCSQILTIFAPNYICFCAARLISGLSSMPMQSSGYTLMLELLSPKKRRLVAVSTAIYWLLSAAIFCWVAYFLRSWQLLCAISSLPVILILFMMRWVPESPSWLLGRGETERAIEVLKYVAKINKVKVDGELSFKLGMLSKLANETETVSFLKSTVTLVKTPNIRKKTLTAFLGWILICMSYHGVNLSQTSSGSQVYLIYSLGSMLEIPICFAHLLLVDRLGRRFLIIFSLAAVAVFSPLTTFLIKDSMWVSFGTSIVTRGLFSLAYNVFFQFAAELFPTVIRGRGVCLMRSLGDVGTTIVPYVINLRTINPVIPTMAFSGMAILSGLLTLLLPETLNQPLPQTVDDAEEFGKYQGIFFCPAFQMTKNTDSKANSDSCTNLATAECGEIQKDFAIHL